MSGGEAANMYVGLCRMRIVCVMQLYFKRLPPHGDMSHLSLKPEGGSRNHSRGC